MLTCNFGYDMIIVLGRCEDRTNFLLNKQRNNPWRISSSRWNAKGYFCSFLVSNICWLTSLSAGSTQTFGLTNLYFLQEDLIGESLCLEDFTCTLVSPLCTFMILWYTQFYKMESFTRKCYVNHSKGRNFHFQAKNNWPQRNRYDMIFLLRAVIRRPFLP